MKVRTDTDRVRHSRKLVMEFLGSSVDTSLADRRTGTDGSTSTGPSRRGSAAAMEPIAAGERDER